MSKATVEIFRSFQDTKQTSGVIVIYNQNRFPLLSSVCLERGWNDNKPNISCLPMGNHPLVLEYSDRFKKDLWEIKETGSRSECKFHSASFWYDLEGCISLGCRYRYINTDDYLDLSYSKFMMERFHSVLKDFDEVELIISGLDWLN